MNNFLKNLKKLQVYKIKLSDFLSTRNLAIGCLVLTSAAYALLNVGSRLLSEGFQPMTQVYLRIGLATLILTSILRKKLSWKRIKTAPIKDMLILLSMGTIGYSIAVYFVTLGALNAKLVNVAIIFASVPFFSYLYAFLFLKKPFNATLTGLLLVSLIGIAFVATKSFIPRFESFGSGEWFTLIATATMAWFFVGRKLLSNHLHTSDITIVVMCIAAISGLVLALLNGEKISYTAFTNTHVLWGLLIGVGMNVLVNPLEIFAFNHLDAVLGSQILLIENIFSLLLGYLLYAETISTPEIVGGLIIASSVYIANKIST